jgi:hypothetical protein
VFLNWSSLVLQSSHCMFGLISENLRLYPGNCSALSYWFSIYHKLPFTFATMKPIATWAVFLPFTFGSACYFSDGTEDTSAQIAPCPSLYNTKMCCWLNNVTYPDACTTQGLCLSNSSDVSFWVDACTDINWGDGCSPLGKICGSLPLPHPLKIA